MAHKHNMSSLIYKILWGKLRRRAQCNLFGSDLVGESMARVSRVYTQKSKIRARELGLIDSIEAHR